MSHTLPSKEVLFIDVPEVDNFDATFVYNFFVPDEGVNPVSEIPDDIAKKSSEVFDANYIDTISRFIPRYIRFTFKPVVIVDFTAESAIHLFKKSSIFPSGIGPKKSNLITSNLDKIINEDEFADFDYIGIDFQDIDIQKKLQRFISGSSLVIAGGQYEGLQQSAPSKGSVLDGFTKGAGPVSPIIGHIPPIEDVGTGFFVRDIDVSNNVFKDLSNISIQTSINAKYANTMVQTSLDDPGSSYNDELVPLYNLTKTLQVNARNLLNSPTFNVNDYKTQIKYLSIEKLTSSTFRNSTDIVGYIIDKYELLEDGTYKTLDPIIVESEKSSTTIDYKIKYGTSYAFCIRAIYRTKFVAISEDTSTTVICTALVSSKQSPKQLITCEETLPPPAPADFNMRWDYENNKLMLTWAFPVNTQRDIKRFQIFRRSNITEPFQLIHEYDFNDALLKYPPKETPSPAVTETLDDAKTFWVDNEFGKASNYIYAMASVDAHELHSGYSSQIQVSFDVFKNKLVKKLISVSGAPKSYPNLYFPANSFVDVMNDEGHRRMRLAFDPDCYNIIASGGKKTPILSTTTNTLANQGSYRLQIVNLDQQKSQVVFIGISDVRTGGG